jgi:hypothetical protein
VDLAVFGVAIHQRRDAAGVEVGQVSASSLAKRPLGGIVVFFGMVVVSC